MASNTRFDARASRPPTPPRDIDDETACDAALSLLSSNISYTLDTPNDSPIATANSNARSSDRGRKHVDFVLTPKHIENTENSNPEVTQSRNKKLYLRTQKPRRSILKLSASQFSSDPPSSDPIPAQEDQNFPTMLEDMMLGLKSSDASARFDAYMVMNGCLKTYKDFPSRQALVCKLPELMSFVRRDLTEFAKGEAVQASRILQEVMKLVKTLCWDQLTMEAMSNPFHGFLLNHAIAALSNENLSKQLTNIYLYFLADNSIEAKVMNNDKANRLITALKDLHERVRGRQIVALRLAIYCNLVCQARSVMIARINDWIEFLFAGMLDGTKEIRVRAMHLGTVAGSEIGVEDSVSRAVTNFLKEPVSSEENLTNFKMVKARLEEWILSKENGEHVPIIWSNVVLLLRSKPAYLERWEYASPWLRLLQKGFNSSNAKIKTRADDAWIRMIFSISPSSRTSHAMAKMLSIPISSQLERARSKPSQKPKDTALHVYGVYCTLLYYAFRPGTDFGTLDSFWQAYIEKVIFDKDGKFLVHPRITHEILESLLFQTQVKSWEECRALGKSAIAPGDLPKLESKWIRSRSGVVFRILQGLIFSEESWALGGRKGSPFMRTWFNLLCALRDAGAKEVKVSTEAMAAMATIVQTLKLYIESTTESTASTRLKRFSLLLQEAIDILGGLVFNEKRLLPSADGNFESTETPSTRVAKSKGQVASPALHLLIIIVSNPVIGGHPQAEYVVEQLYRLCIGNCGSQESKIKLHREMIDFIKPTTPLHSGCKTFLWKLITKGITADLEGTELLSEETSKNPESRGKLCREAVKVLEAGFEQIDSKATTSWCSAFDAVQKRIHSIAGAGGVAVVFTDPLAGFFEHLLASSSNELIQVPAIHLIHKAEWPSSRAEVEYGQRKLWGIANTTKALEFSPFDQLYKMVGTLLSKMYLASASCSVTMLKDLMAAVQHLFRTCPKAFLGILLCRTYTAFHLWISDPSKLLSTTNHESTELFNSVVRFWDTILSRLKDFGAFDDQLLQAIAPTIEPGLTSKHRAIVNRSITMWNSTFGTAEYLTYPPSLLSALFKLSQVAEIQFPGVITEDMMLEVGSTPLDFADTPEDLIEGKSPREAPPPCPENVVAEAQWASSTRSEREAKTPEPTPARRANALTNMTSRLRHDNSQIEFAAIDSSPSILSTIDSQLLTDRQKEIKERQIRETAALFSDMRSSSRPSSRTKSESTPRLKLNQEDIDKVRNVAGEPQSPTLPPTEQMEQYLGSSPTPSQRRSSSRDRPRANAVDMLALPKRYDDMDDNYNGDIPSSPPVSSNAARKQPSDNLQEDYLIVDLTQTRIESQRGLHHVEEVGQLSVPDKDENDNQAEHSEDFCCVKEDERGLENSSTDLTNSTEEIDSVLEITSKTKDETQTHEIVPATEDGQTDMDIDMEDAPFQLFDEEEDPVTSQIARELESFSQDTVIVLSPARMSPTSTRKTRMPAKEKPAAKSHESVAASTSQEGEDMEESIVVATTIPPEHEETLSSQVQTSQSASKHSKKRTLKQAESDTEDLETSSTPLPKRSKPSKKLRWEDIEPQSSRALRYTERHGSLVEPSIDSEVRLVPDRPALSKVEARESSSVSGAETAPEHMSSPPGQQLSERPSGATTVTQQSGAAVPVNTMANPNQPSHNIAAGLEILVAQARAGISREQSKSVVKMCFELMELAVNSQMEDGSI